MPSSDSLCPRGDARVAVQREHAHAQRQYEEAFKKTAEAKRKLDKIAATLRATADDDSDKYSDGGAQSRSVAASKSARRHRRTGDDGSCGGGGHEDGRRDASTMATAGTTPATTVTIAARHASGRAASTPATAGTTTAATNTSVDVGGGATTPQRHLTTAGFKKAIAMQKRLEEEHTLLCEIYLPADPHSFDMKRSNRKLLASASTLNEYRQGGYAQLQVRQVQ